MQAFNCLSAITKHKNHRPINEESYDNVEDLDRDIKAWMDWYNKNMCVYSMEKAESDFKQVREKFPDYKSPTVMDSISHLWNSDIGDSTKVKDSLYRVSMKVYWHWPTYTVKHCRAAIQ